MRLSVIKEFIAKLQKLQNAPIKVTPAVQYELKDGQTPTKI